MARNIDLLLLANRKFGNNSKGGVRSSNSNEPGNLPTKGWIPGTNISSANNYPSIARKGRRGDTELRNVDGQPSHVNSVEAAVIDALGPMGEAWVKEVGSGTINPKTGLEEYFFKKAFKKVSKAWDKCVGKVKAGWNKHVKRGSLVRGLTGESTWKPNEGKWGIFGQTGKSRDRDRTELVEHYRKQNFDSFLKDNKKTDFASMDANQLKDAVVGESGMTDDEYQKYITEYDPRKEEEAMDSFTMGQEAAGDKTAGAMFGQLTKSQAATGKAGFAGSGTFAQDFAQDQLLGGLESEMDEMSASRESQVADTKDAYNQQFWEEMMKWDEAKSG